MSTSTMKMVRTDEIKETGYIIHKCWNSKQHCNVYWLL